jgi:DNA topoisomerase VI subunit B
MKTRTKTHANDRPKLSRTTLTTSRLLDFFSEQELTAQTGHAKRNWPLVLAKELLDNAIDAAEDAGIAPRIAVKVDKEGVTVTDNGPGLPADTVDGVLDFAVRVSSREHYASPTRGAQGNALKTIIAMPFVIDGKTGRVDITANGVRHEIRVAVDRIKQEPKIEHQRHKDRFVRKGTSVKAYCSDSPCSILRAARDRFLQIADDFSWLNPHLSLTLDWFGERRVVMATTPSWKKWLPSDPTSAHWYTSLERLVAGYISDDESKGRNRTIREFVGEFDGLTGSAKQKIVLERTGLARTALSALRKGDGLDGVKVAALLDAMKASTRPIKPAALGVIGKEHLAKRFRILGCEMESFAYWKECGEKDGVPWLIEAAFAATTAAFDQGVDAGRRRIITGVNWSPAVSANQFRELGHESLDSILQEQRAGREEPVVFLLHLACPRVTYTDRGKSAVVIEGDDEGDEEIDL